MFKRLAILASFPKPLSVDHQRKAGERNTYRTEHYALYLSRVLLLGTCLI